MKISDIKQDRLDKLNSFYYRCYNTNQAKEQVLQNALKANGYGLKTEININRPSISFILFNFFHLFFRFRVFLYLYIRLLLLSLGFRVLLLPTLLFLVLFRLRRCPTLTFTQLPNFDVLVLTATHNEFIHKKFSLEKISMMGSDVFADVSDWLLFVL